MDKSEFEIRINEFDQQCTKRDIPVWTRSLTAWFEFTDYRQAVPQEKHDPRLGMYDGANLISSIELWYKQRYPSEALCPEGWGSRLMLIRGAVFELDIPFIINAQLPVDPFKYCTNLSPELYDTLTTAEITHTVDTFNNHYLEASSIVNMTVTLGLRGPALAYRLFEAAWSDLRSIPGTYRPRDHTAMLFLAHQAVEKSLKSRFLVNEPLFSDDQLRQLFGHNLRKLAAACKIIDGRFDEIEMVCAQFDFGQEARYIRPVKSLEESLYLVDCAYSIVAAASYSLRALLGNK